VAVGFNECINARDLTGLARLMANNHTFDTAGTAVIGKAACTEAWRGFFDSHPEYRNVFEAVLAAVTGSPSSATPRVRESPRSQDLHGGQLLGSRTYRGWSRQLAYPTPRHVCDPPIRDLFYLTDAAIGYPFRPDAS
jgi:hypothetical protein